MSKRKKLSDKTRFEVFKRDSFTCQYCGEQAPNVILEVDHINPVSRGGDNDLVNLVTSCRTCNSGKSNNKLSDDAVVTKKKKQLDELQEKRNQLDMMAEWQKGLLEMESSQIDLIDDIIYYKTSGGHNLNSTGRSNMLKLIKKYGLNTVQDATEQAMDKYYNGSDDSVQIAINKIGAICHIKKNDKDGLLQSAYYIRGVLKNRGIANYDDENVMHLIKFALKNIGFDETYNVAAKCIDHADFEEGIDIRNYVINIHPKQGGSTNAK